MKVYPIELFHLEKNFSYLIVGESKDNCILVDPAASGEVVKFLKNFSGYTISHILITHKHWDHVGDLDVLLGILEKEQNNKIVVSAGDPDHADTPNASIIVRELKSSFDIKEIKVTAYQVPCHTRGSLLYYLEDKTDKTNDKGNIAARDTECHRCVFTGDTHFIGGCGKFFEGTGDEMYKNLKTLSELPKDTFIFPGHEYTVDNLKWAMGIEWENEAYGKKFEWAKDQREAGNYTVPSTVEEEFNINIFWRTNQKGLQERVGVHDPAELCGKLRTMKDNKVSLKDGQQKL